MPNLAMAEFIALPNLTMSPMAFSLMASDLLKDRYGEPERGGVNGSR
jgi:hypothetical protein